jgi:hypothetical protein
MKRLSSGVAGTLLLVAPAWMLFSTMVPVPQFRSGTYADYLAVVRACLTLYGGASIGIVVLWWRSARRRQSITGLGVFLASIVGAIAATGTAIVGSGGGNLWGVVVIFGGAFSAIIGAGAGLVWYAVHGPERLYRP